MVTIFKNIRETSVPFYRSVEFVLDRIRNGHNKELVESIRSEKNKSDRNDLKKNLPAVCFSGKFSKRADNSLEEYSSLICLDFDGYETDEQLHEWKDSLSKDKYVMSVFISPSGNGLKALIRVPNEPENHKRYFDALGSYFDTEFFDVTSKNISRVCYESYDPDIYVDNDSVVWELLAEQKYKALDRSTDKVSLPVTDDNKIVEILVKWWKNKFPMVEGARNNNAFILASALNEYGINKSLAEYLLGQHSGDGFSLSEIKQTIDSAYKNVTAHATKYYEDEATLSKMRVKLNKGESIKQDLSSMDISDELAFEVSKSLEKDSRVIKFWLKSEKGTISIVHYLYKEFLQSNGLFKYAPHDSQKYTFVRVTNNLINRCTEEDIKDLVLSHLEKMDDLSIYNHFADRTRYFKEDFLSLLDTADVHFAEDTKSASFIYFKNLAVKVTKDEVFKIDYADLDGYVWFDQVVDRNFDFCDIDDCDFKHFISNISGDDEMRNKSIESTIGFLMSSYKDPGFCPSVILNDEVITDNPEGGTGKGLFVQGLSMMKKVSMIDGKAFSFDSQFAYQTINTDTQLVSFDDVKKGFNFERLFSAITEGLTIEKKNKDAITIPFKFSPKIIITTNYAISGKGNSFERRKWEIELKQVYNKDFTPVDEFGKRFFEQWDGGEWCAFDNYMISNLKYYLSNGLVKAEWNNVKVRHLGQETNHAFIEWIGLVGQEGSSALIQYDKRIFMDDLFSDFVELNHDFRNNLSRTTFYKWLKYYGDFCEHLTWSDGRATQGRWIIYKLKEDDKKEEDTTEIPGLEF